MKQQTGVTEPLRDWFPLSASGAFSDVTDLLRGRAPTGASMKCGCHPNCGIGTAFMVSKKTKEWAPLAAFLDVERLLDDAGQITDAARGPRAHEAADRAQPAAQLHADAGAEGASG